MMSRLTSPRLFNNQSKIRLGQFLVLSGCVLTVRVQAIETQTLQQKALTYQQTGETQPQFNRQQWGLSEEEWLRYEELMQGIRGSISPKTLSPVEVLGTHARSDAERKKYARQWAKIMHEDIARILAFQTAYTEAWHALYPNGKIIDVAKLSNNDEPPPLIQAGDRLLAFVTLKNCSLCPSTIRRVQRKTSVNGIQLDIYFLDTRENEDDDRIRRWAADLPIDTQRIKQGTITLNHDKGSLLNLTGQIPVSDRPQLYRIRNQSIESLPL